MLHLMNAAVMPCEGSYTAKSLTAEEYAERIKLALNSIKAIKSSIGYPAAADIIEQLTGWRPPINRDRTEIQTGDVMLVCRLQYRVADPRDKKHQAPSVGDYEFFEIHHHGVKDEVVKQRLIFYKAKLKRDVNLQDGNSHTRVAALATYNTVSGYIEALYLSGIMDEVSFEKECKEIESIMGNQL